VSALEKNESAQAWLLPAEDGEFGVGEFFVTAVVAAFVDQLFGGTEVVLRRLPGIRVLAEEQ